MMSWCSVYTYMYIPLLCALLLERYACGAGGGKVITLCNPIQYEVEAEIEGSIISPTVSEFQPINCKLKLTGLPEHSWFGLYVKEMELPCDFQYCSGSGHQEICYSGQSYINVEGVNKYMCSPGNTNSISHYTDSGNSVTIDLYSDYYISDDSFNLSYKIASVVDIGASQPVHSVNSKGRSSGYLVSHPGYGREDYRWQTTSKLTLTKLRSDVMKVRFIKLGLYSSWGNCYDYLLVIVNGRTEAKVCGDSQSLRKYKDKWVQFTAEENQITFQFVVTSYWYQSDGFLLEYKVDPPSKPLITSTEVPPNPSTSQCTETVESSTTPVHKGSTTHKGFPPTTFTEMSTTSMMKQTSLTLDTITADGAVPNHTADTSQTGFVDSKIANQNQTSPPPGGGSLYIGVGVGIAIMLVSIIILVVIAVRRRSFRQSMKAEIENGSRFSNSRISQADNNAYELPEMGNGDYSMVDEPVAGGSGVSQSPTSHATTRSNVYSTVSGTGGRLMGTESQSEKKEYCLADEQDDTYYISPDRVEPDQALAEGGNGDTDADISTTYHLADDVTDDPNTDNSSPYCLADDVTCDPVNDRLTSDALGEGVQGITPPTTTTGDTVYQLVEEEDEYVNAAAVMRQEAEVNIDDDYSPIVASTKSGKEVTELIENELYGT